MKYHLAPTRMGGKKYQTDNTKSVKGVDQLEIFHTADGNVICYTM